MEKDEFNYFNLIIFFILCLFFITSIFPEHYPDNKNLIFNLISNYYELNYTVQNLFLNSYNFLKCKIIIDQDCIQKNLSDYNRVSFFIPTFLLIISIFLLNSYFFKKDKNTNITNNIMLSCLCFPSVLLSITSLSSEASYTLISIFVMLNIKSLKKFNVNFLILIILLIYCYQLDRGNSVVFYCFLSGLFILTYIRNFLTFKLFISILFVISILILILESYIFNLIGEFIFIDKIRGLNEEILRLNLHNLSLTESLKRYFYFWITLTSFMLPNKIFIFSFSIILISCLIITNFKKETKLLDIYKFHLSFITKNDQVLFLWLILFPIFMINILPTHAYAKYYLFYLPLLIKLFYNFFNFNIFLYFIFLASCISIIEYKIRFFY